MYDKSIENKSMQNKVIAILGMHRSGTSMLTGCLQESGLVLGKVDSKIHSFNTKGHKEEIFLMELHEEVLKSNGGAWSLPPYEAKWKYFHKECLKFYITSMSHNPVWGFKDPRSLLLLDQWIEEISELKMVGIFRHPIRVAQSLYTRNKMSYNQGLDLWLRYNRKLWLYKKKYDFPIIEFGSEVKEIEQSVIAVIKKMGLSIPSSGLSFIDGNLMHATDSDTKLPKEIEILYSQLQKSVISLGGADEH